MMKREITGAARRKKRWFWAVLLLALVLLTSAAASVRGDVQELIARSKARLLADLHASQAEAEATRTVELIYQNPELPNGCEVTSLAMLLNWAGVETDKLKLYELLPSQTFTTMDGTCYGVEPETAYAGDAASIIGGWYCFEGPIIEAGNAWLEAHGSSLEVQKLSGLGRDELERYLSTGVPLAAWVTLNYQEPRLSTATAWVTPDGTLYTPYSNLHCVVVTGMEDGQYLIADPIEGWTLVDADTFWAAFEAMGSRAVAVPASYRTKERKQPPARETRKLSFSLQLATFYEMPDAAIWLDKAAAQGHKGAVIAKKLFRNGTLTAEERSYVRDNYANMLSSVRFVHDTPNILLDRWFAGGDRKMLAKLPP